MILNPLRREGFKECVLLALMGGEGLCSLERNWKTQVVCGRSKGQCSKGRPSVHHGQALVSLYTEYECFRPWNASHRGRQHFKRRQTDTGVWRSHVSGENDAGSRQDGHTWAAKMLALFDNADAPFYISNRRLFFFSISVENLFSTRLKFHIWALYWSACSELKRYPCIIQRRVELCQQRTLWHTVYPPPGFSIFVGLVLRSWLAWDFDHKKACSSMETK